MACPLRARAWCGRIVVVIALCSGAARARRAGAAEAVASTPTSLPATAPPPGPPPDPARGEGFGAPPAPHSVADDLLWAPRVVLWPVRRALTFVEVPVVELVAVGEEHHVARELSVGTVAPGLSLRPTFRGELGFAPMLGLEAKVPIYASELLLDAGYGGTGNALGAARLRLPPLGSLLATLYGSIAQERDLAYFGIGMFTRDDLALRGEGPARYAFRPGIRSGVHAQIEPLHHLWLSARAEWVKETFVRAPTDDIVDFYGPAQRPGYDQGLDELRPSLGVTWDTRGRVGFGSGFDTFLDATYAEGFGGDGARFADLVGGAAGHVDLGLGTRILTLRVRSELAYALGAGYIPFTDLPSLGGAWLRGYLTGRFRDQSSLLAALEYDWPLHRLVGAELFVEAGEVAGASYQGLSAAKAVPDTGFELRYFPGGGSYSIYGRLGVGIEGVAASLGAEIPP